MKPAMKRYPCKSWLFVAGTLENAKITIPDLGYTTFDLITNNPKKIIGLTGYGLNINDIIKLESEVTEYNKRYLDRKKDKMHHML